MIGHAGMCATAIGQNSYALLQERDSCLVAVSGDGTLSITDLRTLKVKHIYQPSLIFITCKDAGMTWL